MSIQGAPQRRPFLSPVPAVERWQQIDRRIPIALNCSINSILHQPIVWSIAEQIAPVLGVRLGSDSITGVLHALAPGLNDRPE